MKIRFKINTSDSFNLMPYNLEKFNDEFYPVANGVQRAASLAVLHKDNPALRGLFPSLNGKDVVVDDDMLLARISNDQGAAKRYGKIAKELRARGVDGSKHNNAKSFQWLMKNWTAVFGDGLSFAQRSALSVDTNVVQPTVKAIEKSAGAVWDFVKSPLKIVIVIAILGGAVFVYFKFFFKK